MDDPNGWIAHPVTAAMLVMLDLLNSRSFSLNLRFLLSVPMLALVAVRYLSHPRMMFLGGERGGGGYGEGGRVVWLAYLGGRGDPPVLVGVL